MTRLDLGLSALVVVLVLLLGWALFRDNPHKARADAAETQAGLNASTGEIADHANSRAGDIILKSEGLAHDVEIAPGGDQPLPPAVRDRLHSSIGGMRERAHAGQADHTGKPSR